MSNVNKLYQEYPFLEGILPQRRVLSLWMERMDADFLDSSPWFLHGDEPFHTFCLMDEQGKVVTKVGSTWRFLWGFIRQETARQALQRIGTQASQVHYALYHSGVLGKRVGVMYKLPKGVANGAELLLAVEETEGRQSPGRHK
jgi:hypothetical protein